ncbi:hypothetical protein M1146_03655 [Patescibacteria group bacterium]|nr:hypothetical protein [Patescibacteria group bacterium]
MLSFQKLAWKKSITQKTIIRCSSGTVNAPNEYKKMMMTTAALTVALPGIVILLD